MRRLCAFGGCRGGQQSCSVGGRGEENLAGGTARAEPAEDDKKEMKRFIIGVSPAYPRLVVSEW